jgi:hypothetical protein
VLREIFVRGGTYNASKMPRTSDPLNSPRSGAVQEAVQEAAQLAPPSSENAATGAPEIQTAEKQPLLQPEVAEKLPLSLLQSEVAEKLPLLQPPSDTGNHPGSQNISQGSAHEYGAVPALKSSKYSEISLGGLSENGSTDNLMSNGNGTVTNGNHGNGNHYGSNGNRANGKRANGNNGKSGSDKNGDGNGSSSGDSNGWHLTGNGNGIGSNGDGNGSNGITRNSSSESNGWHRVPSTASLGDINYGATSTAAPSTPATRVTGKQQEGKQPPASEGQHRAPKKHSENSGGPNDTVIRENSSGSLSQLQDELIRSAHRKNKRSGKARSKSADNRANSDKLSDSSANINGKKKASVNDKKARSELSSMNNKEVNSQVKARSQARSAQLQPGKQIQESCPILFAEKKSDKKSVMSSASNAHPLTVTQRRGLTSPLPLRIQEEL